MGLITIKKYTPTYLATSGTDVVASKVQRREDAEIAMRHVVE